MFQLRPVSKPASFIDSVRSTISQLHRGFLGILKLGGKELPKRRPKAKQRPRQRPKQRPKQTTAKQEQKTDLGKEYHHNKYLRMRLNLKRLRSNLKRKPQQSQDVATKASKLNPSHLASPSPPRSASQQEVLYSIQKAPPPRSLPSPPVIQFTPWTPIFEPPLPQSTPDVLQPFPHNKGSPYIPSGSSILGMATEGTTRQSATVLASTELSQPQDNATAIKLGSFNSPPSINIIDAVISTSSPLIHASDQYLSDSEKPEQLQESYTAPKSVVTSHQQEQEEAAVDAKTHPPFIFSVDSLDLSGPLSQIRKVKGEPLDEGYIAPKRHQELNEGHSKSTEDTQSLQRVELNGLSQITQYIPYNPEYLAHVYGNSVVSISH